MAAHHGSTPGWWDTPCNPLVGLALFVLGILVIWMAAVYAASRVFG